MSIPTYLTLGEIARQTGLSYDIVRHVVVKKRHVPSVKQGKIYLVHKKHLAKVVSRQNGQSQHPLHHKWRSIRYRGLCGRGWREFNQFIVDVERLPGEGSQLRRIDLTKKYSKTNAQWG